MTLKNTVIHLIGFGGVGKYTIAKLLSHTTGAKIIDNHLINNPVFGVIELGQGKKLSEEVWIQTRKIRQVVLDSIKTLSPDHFSFVFTNILHKDDEMDQSILDSIIGISQTRNAIYIPVRLYCDQEENAKRIVSPTRSERLKPTNAERVYHDKQLIEISHPNLLDLDVTSLSAEQAAEIILEHTQKRFI